jgi:hypothetical protein
VDEWPMLAAWWLADGFDSALLRELAGLGTADTMACRELIHEVLGSIGYPVPVESEFADRCRVPVGIVQRDLKATGFGRYQLHPRNLLVGPISLEMWAALPDGSSWSGGGNGMTPGMDDLNLLWHAAASVSDTLGEVLGIAWPVCAVHGGAPMTPPDHREVPGGFIDGAVWWWCRTRAGHAVVPVGQLTPQAARTRTPG